MRLSSWLLTAALAGATIPHTVQAAQAGDAGAAAVLPVRMAPVDPQAMPSTKAEYAWLREIWGKKTIAGQQDLTWDDQVDMARRVFDDTGRWPALMGFDFMNTGMPADGNSGLHQVSEAIAWARRGGLVAFCWHWRDPSLL